MNPADLADKAGSYTEAAAAVGAVGVAAAVLYYAVSHRMTAVETSSQEEPPEELKGLAPGRRISKFLQRLRSNDA